MATSSNFRFSFGVNFASQEDKDAFLHRLGEARRVLKQPDNTVLLNAMLDLVLAAPSPATTGSTGPSVPAPMHTKLRRLYGLLDTLLLSFLSFVCAPT